VRLPAFASSERRRPRLPYEYKVGRLMPNASAASPADKYPDFFIAQPRFKILYIDYKINIDKLLQFIL